MSVLGTIILACLVFLVLNGLALWLPVDWVVPGVAFLALVCGAAWYVLRPLDEEALIARGILERFLFNIAFPLGLLLGVPLLVLAWLLGVDASLTPALIAGLVIATGWLTTAIFGELERKRAKEEKLRDFHKALYGEIGSAVDALYIDGQAEAFAAEIVERMYQDHAFVPFIPLESHDRVYGAILSEIEVLPRQTIDSIIAFYAMLATMNAQAQDMRGEGYKSLSQSRRIAMYEDYFLMRKRAFRLGEFTLNLISQYADGGAKAAEAYAGKVNSPDAGQRPHLSAGSE